MDPARAGGLLTSFWSGRGSWRAEESVIFNSMGAQYQLEGGALQMGGEVNCTSQESCYK